MAHYNRIIYTDGSGESGYVGGKACAVFTQDGKTPTEVMYKVYTTKLTCNEAEYQAVILALKSLPEKCSVKIISDSMLVVNQLDIENPWKINFEHLLKLNQLAREIITEFKLDVEFQYIPRDSNLAGLFIEGKLKVSPDIVTNLENECPRCKSKNTRENKSDEDFHSIMQQLICDDCGHGT